RLAGLSVPQSVQVILEDVPPPLRSIDRRLRGDVETIISKAIAKRKEQRYQTASELGADIERFLSDQPICARAPSELDRWLSMARRHRTFFVTAALGAAVLTVAVLIATLKAAQASVVIVILGLSIALAISMIRTRQARIAQRTAEDANEAYRA